MIIEQTFISEDGIYGFNREIVEQYLAIVDDENPIHEYIVPGQLIVEKVFSMMDDQWASYKIKYVQTTDINETIDFEWLKTNELLFRIKLMG